MQSLIQVDEPLGKFPAPLIPPGTCVPYAGSAAPPGWLLCDGSLYGVQQFEALFAAIGTAFGGSGNTFQVPDLRGRVAVGAGHGSGLTNRSLGAGGGEESHTLTTAEMPSHSHTASSSMWSDTGPASLASGAATAATASTSFLNTMGGDGAHNNMQPFLALNYIIKT